MKITQAHRSALWDTCCTTSAFTHARLLEHARLLSFLTAVLFLASRYPVMEAEYRCFPNGRGEDALAAKGLLAVKVQHPI